MADMRFLPGPRAFFLPAILGLALLAAACSGRVGTDAIRSSMASGQTSPLLEKMRETHANYREVVTALNLARLYQIEGQWRLSIKAFDEALLLLEDYESRAVYNLRDFFAGAGTFLLARGSRGYYGTGYERSLLHTFNALNYMMLGDFSGAAVEMRRMELRQELWLQESESRLEQNLEKLRQRQAHPYNSPDSLPLQYSMRAMLSDPAVRALANNYQDPFSYALSSVLCRLAGDAQYAEVSRRRAAALNDGAAAMFDAAWPRPEAEPETKSASAPKRKGAGPGRGNPAARAAADQTKAGTGPRVRRASPAIPSTETPERTAFVPAGAGDAAARLDDCAPRQSYVPPLPPEADPPPRQELTIIAFTGLAPSLRVEHVRISFPVIGYLLLDLPSYAGAVRGAVPSAICSAGNELVFYPLLRTDLLAYRTLQDEVRIEMAAAVTRGMIRAGLAATATAAAASREDMRGFAPLAGLLTTAIIDLFTTPFSASARNWETLPNSGYLALASVARGSTVSIRIGDREAEVSLPENARGGIIMATQLSNANLNVYHMAY